MNLQLSDYRIGERETESALVKRIWSDRLMHGADLGSVQSHAKRETLMRDIRDATEFEDLRAILRRIVCEL